MAKRKLNDNQRAAMLAHAWQPGQSGNPAGKPPGTKSYRARLQNAFVEMLQQDTSYQGTTMPTFNAFIRVLQKSMLDPNSQAFRYVLDSVFGDNLFAEIDSQINNALTRDLDFVQYRIYKLGFDIQQRVLLSTSRDIGLMAGRRSGKTETNKLKSASVSVVPHKRALIIGLTITKTEQLYRDAIVSILESTGHAVKRQDDESKIIVNETSIVQFGGNANRAEREKYRGFAWDLIIIDEAQSQPELERFVTEVIKPMLLDTNGQLIISGSGPRVRGTYWEYFFTNPSPGGLRLNWDLSQNPHIHDHKNALARYREDNKLSETDAIYLREGLGKIVYDDDALVFRLGADNYYTDDDLSAWIRSQPRSDIHFLAGLDYGYVDADAFVIVMYSETSNKKFVIYEYCKPETDVTTLIDAIKSGIAHISDNPLFAEVVDKSFAIFADTSDQKISMEFARYGIVVANAYKYDKSMAIQMLQSEVRQRNLMVKRDSIFDRESLRIIFRRQEIEGKPSVLTREIDDEVYHSDLMDALLYSLRVYWLAHSPDHELTDEDVSRQATDQAQRQIADAHNESQQNLF